LALKSRRILRFLGLDRAFDDLVMLSIIALNPLWIVGAEQEGWSWAGAQPRRFGTSNPPTLAMCIALPAVNPLCPGQLRIGHAEPVEPDATGDNPHLSALCRPPVEADIEAPVLPTLDLPIVEVDHGLAGDQFGRSPTAR
jgi:hypothetical protein